MPIHTRIKLKPIPTIIFSLVGITIISSFILSRSPSSSLANAATSTATASVTVPDACSLASSSTNHTGTVNGGTYTENFGGESTVTVTCNDRNGYSVYAVGCSGTNTDCLDTNHTSLIGTSTGLIIPTGTSTSTSVSNWAMKLTPGTGTFAPTILNGYNNYSLVPTTATKVATLTSDINVSNSSQFKTSYAVSVSPSQAADTYIGKVKYTVVHPNYITPSGDLESYPITLGFTYADSIIIDGVSYTSSSTTPNLTHGTHTISGTYPEGFSSWSSTGGVTVTSASSASTTITVTGAGTLTLTGQKPKIYIQDLTLASCQVNVGANGNATNVGDEIDVYDKRDEKAYKVRYINGECWMTQNLRYLGDTGSAAKTMTIGNNNSNVANKSIALYSIKNGDAQTFNAYDYSKCGDGSTAGYNNACVYDSGSTSTGVWYNYYAASGGTISTNSNSTAASSDICPKNWHLPSGPSTTTNTDYNKLIGNTTSGNQAATTGLTAFGAVAGGFYDNYGILSTTRDGYWWSATASNATDRYYLDYNSSTEKFNSNYYYYRCRGYFVRCVRSS